MIRAIVFDFDGLILDTESHEYDVLQCVYAEYGQTLPLSVWGECIGTKSPFDPYVYLESLVGTPLDHAAVHDRRTQLFSERILAESARPGVIEYLSDAKHCGLQIGLASSSSRAWVTGHLERLHLLQYFSTVCTSDDVVEVKPNPALYQLAVSNLGVKPEEAIAFEDSPNGALAAKRAGLYCVAVPNRITETLTFGEVDLRLSSMADCSLRDVIDRLRMR